MALELNKPTKSSYSNSGGNCLQATKTDDAIEVRDTKLGDDSPVLRFTAAEWTAFLNGSKDGEFDLS